MFEYLLKRDKNGNGHGPGPEPERNLQRPKIGLVLGGGAARGFAHVGFIRTLEAHGIKPDVIAGTSIGAVVGGCYAAGKMKEFEEWARGLTRGRVFRYLDISLSGSGLIDGNRLAAGLEEALGKTLIDDLPIRFVAIATEIGSGHEIWLTRGRLVEALRASYALPGIFAPVHLGDRWLVDGALVNPVPVSAARAFDARIVIAVNLNADLLGRGSTIPSYGTDEVSEPAPAPDAERSASWRNMFSIERLLKRQFLGEPGRPGIPTVMTDAFNVMQDRITRARLAGDPPDVLVSPRLGRIGLFDFHRADEAITIGTETAEKSIEAIAEAIAALA